MKQIRYLLDTSVYSQRLKVQPDPTVVRWWSREGNAAMAISAICESELLYGLKKRNSSRLWTEYHTYLENRLVVLPVDQAVAKVYADLRVEGEAMGQSRGDMDLLIAATALVNGLQVATLNQKHFVGIQGLRLVTF